MPKPTFQRILRGPQASGMLASLKIDARRYWLLIDLFGQLSERGELLDQLGTDGVALKAAAWMYAAVSVLLAILLAVAQPRPGAYLPSFIILTAFLLSTVLLSEAGNSLVNPAEGLILAHQPINGATYFAAKLTHLARIILYFVPAINIIPAFVGLLLKDAGWTYPLVHLSATLAVGLVSGLLCCAMYGWLIRFVPARRLKAAGQFAATIPLLAMIGWQPLRQLLARVDFLGWLPDQTGLRWCLALAGLTLAAAAVAFGIRSLSADYLVRVAIIVHGTAPSARSSRTSRFGNMVTRLLGGQSARAGYEFVIRLSRRDFQFQRQLAPTLIAVLVGLIPAVAAGWRTDPFSGRFTTVHLLPHMTGAVLFFICSFIPFGSDFKAAWIFLLAPARALDGLARGTYAALFIPAIAVPHLILLSVFAWPWGVWHSALFIAYSVAISSLYLALELRMVDSIPFSKPVDPRRGATLLPLMAVGGAGAAVAVGLQYYLFRSPALVGSAALILGLAAYFITRSSLAAMGRAARYSLGLLSGESAMIYREIDV